MENKRTKKALDDETLDQVTGGTGGYGDNFLTKETSDELEIQLIQGGVCPKASNNLSEHGMLEPDGPGNYLCKWCGIRWVIPQ